MKTSRNIGLLISAVMVIVSYQSIAQQKTAKEILKDPIKKEEIKKTICNDHEMMNDMMQQMMSNHDMMKKDTTMYQYGIRGIPNVKLFYQGKVINEFRGTMSENMIKQWLDENIPLEEKR